MARTVYSPEFIAKMVLDVLIGEKALGVSIHESGIIPNMLRDFPSGRRKNGR